MRPATHIDLFSGIGGFALAAQWAGFRTIAFCEIDKYCQKVLAKNFGAVANANGGGCKGHELQQASVSEPASESSKNFMADATSNEDRWLQQPKLSANTRARSPIHSNIFDFDGTAYRGCDLLTGGFPCQPFSVAGKRRGAADDRAIWPEMFRVIKEARPAWVLGENVPGIIPMELDNVLSDLESIGYATRPFVIPACAVDARHRRDRLWIIGRLVADLPRIQQGRQIEWPERERIGPQGQTMADNGIAIERRFSRTRRRIGEYCEVEEDCWRGGRQANGQWLPEPDVGRVVDGLSLELDFARQITAHEKSNRSQTKPARNLLVWKMLRAVWEHRESATTSPEVYIFSLQASVPEVPLFDSQSRWLLGGRIEEEPDLRDMWQEFYAAGLASSQDMQFRLLERAREKKRRQTVGNRVNRLKGLGNAIVPQVAYEILREIRKLI